MSTVGVEQGALKLWEALLGPEVDLPPFIASLGIVPHTIEEDAVELAYAPQAEHMNSYGVAHGGAVMTLLDAAMACAVHHGQARTGAVTIEMKTTFMRAATGPLIARGTVLHRSATLVFAQASLVNAQGKFCAHASGTFKLVPSGIAKKHLARVA